MSAAFRLGSLRKRPCCGSAPHGGMTRAATFSRIAVAQGRTSLYVMSDIGATSPGRWQLTQFLYTIGATSRLKVGDSAAAPVGRTACPASPPPANATNRTHDN